MSGVVLKKNSEKYCRECAALINAKAEICPKCGVRQVAHYPSSGVIVGSGKSRVAAIVIALFLGGFGGHKFYLGQVGFGLLYLLFFWTLIPCVVATVELIIYLTMSDEAFAHKYDRRV